MSQFHVMRGSIPDVGTINNEIKVYLFDGSFDTGFKIVDFQIAPSNWALDSDVAAILSTESVESNAYQWDWSDNRQKGWATYQANGASATGNYYQEHLDDIIVEDLYIKAWSQTTQSVNYKIVLEKVKITEYRGALALVMNASQG